MLTFDFLTNTSSTYCFWGKSDPGFLIGDGYILTPQDQPLTVEESQKSRPPAKFASGDSDGQLLVEGSMRKAMSSSDGEPVQLAPPVLRVWEEGYHIF